jgi:hypothetical protein
MLSANSSSVLVPVTASATHYSSPTASISVAPNPGISATGAMERTAWRVPLYEDHSEMSVIWFDRDAHDMGARSDERRLGLQCPHGGH